MRLFRTIILLAVSIFPPAVAVTRAQDKTPVVVELFTSEGCPTCPPADRNLMFLEREQPVPGVEIIALAFHVDYWNTPDWQDKFSSPIFSRRQELYSRRFKINGTFTPQMVVDGRQQLIGSRLDEARKAVAEAAKTEKPKMRLIIEKGKLKVEISNLAGRETATVFLATGENELSSKVGGGDNSGKTLVHASIVRELMSLGTIPATAQNFAAETFLQPKPEWKTENLKIVVFVQENFSRRIVAAGQVKFPS